MDGTVLWIKHARACARVRACTCGCVLVCVCVHASLLAYMPVRPHACGVGPVLAGRMDRGKGGKRQRDGGTEEKRENNYGGREGRGKEKREINHGRYANHFIYAKHNSNHFFPQRTCRLRAKIKQACICAWVRACVRGCVRAWHACTCVRARVPHPKLKRVDGATCQAKLRHMLVMWAACFIAGNQDPKWRSDRCFLTYAIASGCPSGEPSSRSMPSRRAC